MTAAELDELRGAIDRAARARVIAAGIEPARLTAVHCVVEPEVGRSRAGGRAPRSEVDPEVVAWCQRAAQIGALRV